MPKEIVDHSMLAEDRWWAAAPLGGEREPVLVMVGLLLPFYPYSETQIRVRKRQKIKLPRSKGPFYTHMTTPRLEADAMAWLKDNGGNIKVIEWALKDHRLLRVPPGSSADALKTFTGFRLVPRIAPPGADQPQRKEHRGRALRGSRVLAGLLAHCRSRLGQAPAPGRFSVSCPEAVCRN